MMRRTFPLLLMAWVALLWACGPKTEPVVQVPVKSFEHPEWIKDKTIYEVNLRQYTQSGKIADFQTHLPRLKQMGVDVLWFMPLYPIGQQNKKGEMGSYYAVADYTAVDPEFGTLEDFKALVKAAHDQQMYVILDWVANHTAWDSKWAKEHPDWFTKDSVGGFMPPQGTDWSDVIDLNYDNAQMRQAMTDALAFWVREADIDGYRCDVASWVPLDFWQSARAVLDTIKPVFMLAEAEELEYHDRAFDMSYGWNLNGLFNDIAAGKKSASDLHNFWKQEEELGLVNRQRMIFTSNHDENTWHGTEFDRLGAGAKTFAVLAATMPGMPLVYSGQEVGLDRRLEFFKKDVIEWKESPYTEFYTTLLQLRRANAALWIGKDMGDFARLKTGNDHVVFAFARSKGDKKVITLANLSAEAVDVDMDTQTLVGEYTDLFAKTPVKIEAKLTTKLAPWQYVVYVK